MHTFGSDFQWAKAEDYFQNLDKLISHINSHFDDIELLYSTPSDYTHEINKQNLAFPSNSDDFFPYADEPGAYWTGYFTSRPAFKGLVKSAGRNMQILRKFMLLWLTYDRQNPSREKMLISLREAEKALAVCQHHDSVTGTSKQYVIEDYKKTLLAAMEDTLFNAKEILRDIILKETKEETELIVTYNRNLSHWHEV